jgi:serine/threonine protein kinase
MGLCSSHEAASISRYYDIQENCILGEGTSSIVFRGVCRGTGEPVAIKRIEKEKTSQGIEDEIAFLQCLHHANIISLCDVFKTVRFD